MPSYKKLKHAPGTFHIRKTISKTKSNLLNMQNPHRFTVRIENRTKWWEVAEDHPCALLATQYWDPPSNAFHTLLGKDGFQGQLQISLSQKIPGKDIRGVNKRVDCTFIVEPGLKADVSAVETGPGPRTLIPWAALCNMYHDQSGVSRLSDDRWIQMESGYIIFNTTPFPTYCEVNAYSWHFYGINVQLRARYRRMWIQKENLESMSWCFV
jgi:hypothetical protein